MAVKLNAAACSNKGCRRHNNEDNFCLNGLFMQRSEMDRGGLFKLVAQGDALFAVCDGMGGEEAGEEASLLSAQLCAQYLKGGSLSSEREKLRSFMHQGCVSVLKQAQKNENHSGSTVTMIIADKSGLHAANMGDSRIYRLTAKGMTQISEDHTEIQRLLKLGAITPDQVKTHPKRHMIRQYWGMPLSIAPFTPYIGPAMPYVNGEKYLLCSDGLTDMLEDCEIEAILRQSKPVDQICQELIDAALLRGGRDNVTAIVLEVESDEAKRPAAAADEKGLKRQRNLLAALLAVLCAADVYMLGKWIECLMAYFMR